MIKLCIFDLDGTLVNSVFDLADAVNYALKNQNYPLHNVDEFYTFVGNGVPKLIERALPENCRTEEIESVIKKDFDDYYNKNSVNKTVPYDGVNELIDILKKSNIKLAVASNKPDNFTNHIVRHFFSDKFDYIYGNREGIPKKPDACCVNMIIKEMDVLKEETLYIGDSNVDIFTAKNAELKSVGCLWGFRTEKELVSAGADYIVSSPLEIESIINKINDK